MWLAPLILVGVVATAVTAKLLVRRRAPEGGWFTDLTRSAGSLTLIGTMFAVMLAFVILFALQSFQRAKDGSSLEGVAVTEMSSVADALPSPAKDRLRGDLVCYGRAVISDEWAAMKEGGSSDLVESWVAAMHRDFASADPRTASEEAAYAQWFDQEAQRRDGRRQRLGEAAPTLPLPLWFALGLGATATLTYMVVQADPRENRLIQALPIACVSALVTAGLLVVVFLDRPYSGNHGSVAPTEMTRTVALIDSDVDAPCDERGSVL
ncbi:DUF4239 domain-containing protein [Mycolicibacterium sp. BiH015]|uniref:bestrophin-like domain n=1 Tax=Mycolicibacterium sp. BiH015 TaxID=3018808 RepID=UPI0022E48074|nr:DUF4239 domain-containing protein [Mycolicibacterium sp. BiH015]MDA2891468.1 DUF4239 domain-containing protein [Mycolicibacterium sp. BiH015]